MGDKRAVKHPVLRSTGGLQPEATLEVQPVWSVNCKFSDETLRITL